MSLLRKGPFKNPGLHRCGTCAYADHWNKPEGFRAYLRCIWPDAALVDALAAPMPEWVRKALESVEPVTLTGGTDCPVWKEARIHPESRAGITRDPPEEVDAD